LITDLITGLITGLITDLITESGSSRIEVTMDFSRSDRRPQRITCPTCQSQFDPALTPAMPFCSVRCQQVDLGRWFNEEIGLPVARSAEDEEEEWELE
jgi:endogenous inhibitor of DNA gyrase (YacG/DUF329 family)